MNQRMKVEGGGMKDKDKSGGTKEKLFKKK